MIRVWVNRGTRRHYTAHLAEDLLGDLVLVQSWGSLDSGAGRIQKKLMESHREGQVAIKEIARRRKAHGYLLVAQKESASIK